MHPRVSNKKNMMNQKTAALFNNSVLQSNEIFMHCSRIPDVMTRIIKARRVFKKYKLQPPAWMFGLMDKGETFNSPAHLRLMFFLVSVGLYDRLVRRMGLPHFLIGNSQALLVAAKIRTFEKSIIRIFCEAETTQTALMVYQKSAGNISQFSLLHLSETVKDAVFHSITQEYGVDRCILIFPFAYGVKQPDTTSASFTVEGLIEMDPQLAWLWPILKRRQMKSEKISSNFFSLNTFFH